MASTLRVCLNFSFVALKTSIFLSYLKVSSLLPPGFSSKIISFAGLSASGRTHPLKYSCRRSLPYKRITQLLLASSWRGILAFVQANQ